MNPAPFLQGTFWPGGSAPAAAGAIVIHGAGDAWYPYQAGFLAQYVGGQLGVLLQAMSPGQGGPIQVSGPIDPRVFSLGSGAAQAVYVGQYPSRSGSGQAIGLCDAAGQVTIVPSYATSAMVGTIGGYPIASAAPPVGGVLAWDGAEFQPVGLGGDLQAGAPNAGVVPVSVTKVQGVSLPAPPLTGTTVLTDTSGALSWAAAGAPGIPPPATPVEGDLLMYKSGAWSRFAAGVAGAVLTAAGAAADPAWQTVATGFFGDGSDGTATCDGAATVAGMSRSGSVYTMTRDCYFATLTINSGVTVKGAGFRLFVSGVLALAGTFSVAGTAGASGGGGGGALARLGNGSDGANGGTAGVTCTLGGAGGNCSFGTTGGSATPPDPTLGSPRDATSAIRGVLESQAGLLPAIMGGVGGAGAGSAIGGGGGGVAIVVANTLSGAGTITAAGGAGMLTGGNGSGGGGGGYVALVTRTKAAWTGTITAAGGAAGPGGGGATAGGAGTVIQIQG